MTDDQMLAASKLWRKGAVGREIAKQVNATLYEFKAVVKRNRDMFPRRRDYRSWLKVSTPRAPKPIPDGRVRWVTASGASVTLPRVSFISCPRSA